MNDSPTTRAKTESMCLRHFNHVTNITTQELGSGLKAGDFLSLRALMTKYSRAPNKFSQDLHIICNTIPSLHFR